MMIDQNEFLMSNLTFLTIRFRSRYSYFSSIRLWFLSKMANCQSMIILSESATGFSLCMFWRERVYSATKNRIIFPLNWRRSSLRQPISFQIFNRNFFLEQIDKINETDTHSFSFAHPISGETIVVDWTLIFAHMLAGHSHNRLSYSVLAFLGDSRTNIHQSQDIARKHKIRHCDTWVRILILCFVFFDVLMHRHAMPDKRLKRRVIYFYRS